MIEEVKKQISELPKNIRVGQQNKHIAGTNEYKQYVKIQKIKGEYGPSRLNGGIEFAQELVNKYSGTGDPRMKCGRWLNYEFVEANENIGIVVNNLNGIERETNRFKIHYNKNGTHIVPDYPAKKRGKE